MTAHTGMTPGDALADSLAQALSVGVGASEGARDGTFTASEAAEMMGGALDRARKALEEYRAKRAAQKRIEAAMDPTDERWNEKVKIEMMAKRAEVRDYNASKGRD